jgi:hypothetical protein
MELTSEQLSAIVLQHDGFINAIKSNQIKRQLNVFNFGSVTL